jgi:hypothetical protein
VTWLARTQPAVPRSTMSIDLSLRLCHEKSTVLFVKLQLIHVVAPYCAVLRHARRVVSYRVHQQPQSEGLEPLKSPTVEPPYAAGNASDH